MSRVLVVARALWASSHPGPSVIVTVLTLALAVAAQVPAGRTAVVVLAVFAGQLSVGISNDAIDARRDRAVARTDKPLARGDTSLRTAWIAVATCAAIAVILSAVLGPGVLLSHGVALMAAWAYNVVLKSTALSIVPFLISFGLLPSIASLAAEPAAWAPAWATAAGAALGAAVHLANVLPDLDDDRRTGVRGLPHRLGARADGILASLGVIGGAAAVLLGPGRLTIAGAVLCALAVVTAVVAGMLASRARPGRIVFRLVMLAALLLAAQLVVTGGFSG